MSSSGHPQKSSSSVKKSTQFTWSKKLTKRLAISMNKHDHNIDKILEDFGEFPEDYIRRKCVKYYETLHNKNKRNTKTFYLSFKKKKNRKKKQKIVQNV